MLPDKDGPGVGGRQGSSEGEDPSVGLFREYLRLRTVHPDPDYGETFSSQHQTLLAGFVVVYELILTVKAVLVIDSDNMMISVQSVVLIILGLLQVILATVLNLKTDACWEKRLALWRNKIRITCYLL